MLIVFDEHIQSCNQRLTEHFQYPNLLPHSTTDLISISIDSFCLFLNKCHINGTIHFVLFYAWLLSFSMMFLRLIHVVAQRFGRFNF